MIPPDPCKGGIFSRGSWRLLAIWTAADWDSRFLRLRGTLGALAAGEAQPPAAGTVGLKWKNDQRRLAATDKDEVWGGSVPNFTPNLPQFPG